MIYLDPSVVLAHLLAEDHRPPASLWSEVLVSSRLLEYETWTRVHARGLAQTHGEELRTLLDRIAFVRMDPMVLGRALEPFPVPVRTLDAIHLASLHHLLELGQWVILATYNQRMLAPARALGWPIQPLEGP